MNELTLKAATAVQILDAIATSALDTKQALEECIAFDTLPESSLKTYLKPAIAESIVDFLTNAMDMKLSFMEFEEFVLEQ